MFNALIAIVATVGALAAAGTLVSRTHRQRSPYLMAWSLAMSAIVIALCAMTIGFLIGFGSLLFRATELGGALIAPVWLVVGVVELIAYYVQVRFAVRLFAASYTIVAVVIALLDPLQGRFGAKDLPKPDDHYTWLPLTLISVAHVLVVLGLVACAAVTALRIRGEDPDAYGAMLPVALAALAGVLMVVGSRGLLPGFLAVLLLGAAAGLVWYAAVRIAQGQEDFEPLEDYEDEPVAHAEDRPRRAGAPPDPVAARAPAPGPDPDALRPTSMDMMGEQAPSAGGRRRPAEPYGQITVYTLLDGREEAFDRLAADAVHASREAEPDTLMYICHEVVNSPTQRIFYQLFRSEAAYRRHRHLPQVQRFATASRLHVLAMNVVELKVGEAKTPPLPESATQDHPR
jgi:quinol monooxygenase YgiN